MSGLRWLVEGDKPGGWGKVSLRAVRLQGT
jgi:hypothetical protein